MSKSIQLQENGENVYPCPYFPVGSIYLSVVDTNPSTYFGGTWEKISGGFLWGCNTSIDNNLKTSGGVGTFTDGGGNTGSTTLTVDQIPSHYHSGLNIDNVYMIGWDSGSYRGLDMQTAINSHGITNVANRLVTTSVGGGKGHTHTYPNHSHEIPHIGV